MVKKITKQKVKFSALFTVPPSDSFQFVVRIDLVSAQVRQPEFESTVDVLERSVGYLHAKFTMAVESKVRSLICSLD